MSFILTLGIGALQLIGSLLGMPVMRSFGRRTIYIVGTYLTILVLVGIGLGNYFDIDPII